RQGVRGVRPAVASSVPRPGPQVPHDRYRGARGLSYQLPGRLLHAQREGADDHQDAGRAPCPGGSVTAYTLHTNILIRFSQHLPRDIFPGIWEALESLVEDGRACICEMVLKELERGGDDLHAWARALEGFTCPTDQHEIPIVQQISAAHPDWISGTENE